MQGGQKINAIPKSLNIKGEHLTFNKQEKEKKTDKATHSLTTKQARENL